MNTKLNKVQPLPRVSTRVQWQWLPTHPPQQRWKDTTSPSDNQVAKCEFRNITSPSDNQVAKCKFRKALHFLTSVSKRKLRSKSVLTVGWPKYNFPANLNSKSSEPLVNAKKPKTGEKTQQLQGKTNKSTFLASLFLSQFQLQLWPEASSQP